MLVAFSVVDTSSVLVLNRKLNFAKDGLTLNELEVAWIVSALWNYLVSMISWSVITVFLEPVFFTIVLHSWSNNQLSCSILRKIFMMRVGGYERIINYDWPNDVGIGCFFNKICCRHCEMDEKQTW